MATDVQEPITSEAETPPHNVAIKSIKLTNLLSFGPDMELLRLRPLNILIGANGSGKSNFIRAISLLQAAPNDLLTAFIRSNSTVSEWIWKGKQPRKLEGVTVPELEVYLPRKTTRESDLNYHLSFVDEGRTLQIVDEWLKDNSPGEDIKANRAYLSHSNTRVALRLNGSTEASSYDEIDYLSTSALAHFKGPAYEQISFVGELFSSIRIYSSLNFDGQAEVRGLNPVNARINYLEEDGSNLAGLLVYLSSIERIKVELLDYLQQFYPSAKNLGYTSPNRGFFRLLLKEGDFVTPASLLSDGTLRWLALLAILLHPTLPPLICLEEPELGLHPDMIPTLAHLLRRAATRTQLIVTTHSEQLVDQFTGTPEDVIVCEKLNGATTMRRLSSERLSNWLKEDYTLGQLWAMDITGGRR